MYAILVPEAIILWAMRQWFVSRRIAYQYQDRGWTEAHGVFVQMGGLVYDDGKHFHVVTIGPKGVVRLGDQNVGDPRHTALIPDISEDEIRDKGKSDVISKAVVVVQTTWFVFHCLARAGQGLAITGLELVTLAFATLNIATYFLWLKKPLNAQYPIYFKKHGERSLGPKRSLLAPKGYQAPGPPTRGRRPSLWQHVSDDVREQPFVRVLWRWCIQYPFVAAGKPLRDIIGMDKVQHRTWVGQYYSGYLSGRDKDIMVIASAAIGVVFGGIHLAGWNLNFPTVKEQMVWRIMSIIITVEPVLLGFYATFHYFFVVAAPGDTKAVLNHITDWAFLLFALIGPIVYAFARMTLLVQTLVALRQLPSTAFENVVWSTYLPHF